MAKDPAFLFYPGDYLRDTQCLSEKTQVAYDRIMCEHMRNISTDMNNIIVSKDKVNFFTKRLSPEEKQELFTVLIKKPDGYQIEWVAESIADRKLYAESRSKNRTKKDESYENTSKHMEDEDEDVNNNTNTKKKSVTKKKKKSVLKPIPFNTSPTTKDFNELPEQYIKSSIEAVLRTSQVNIDEATVLGLWSVFKVQNLTGKNYYPNEGRVYSHFINVIKKEKFTNGTGNKKHGVADSVTGLLSKPKW